MSKSLNVFKSYNIADCNFGYKEIQYIDNNEMDFTYTSIDKISKYFEKQGLKIPVYDWLEPPINEALDLINPEDVSIIIDLILNECSDNIKETFLELKKFSDKGYYFVWDEE